VKQATFVVSLQLHMRAHALHDWGLISPCAQQDKVAECGGPSPLFVMCGPGPRRA